MKKPLLFTLFSESQLLQNIRSELDLDHVPVTLHEFPDGETYLKVDVDPKNKTCVIFETFSCPNPKFLPLVFLAETLRDLGAKHVGLIAPYLSYMRQDKRFHSGEALTSKYFAKLISNCFDWMISVDPHLHRIKTLQDIYSIPTAVVHAATNISHWIKIHIDRPLLIGPDSESQQWIEQIAQESQSPFLILEKIRRGDQQVKISVPQIEKYRNFTPVLIDDIISTAKTMIETMKQLNRMCMHPPTCIAIHSLLVGNAHEELIKAGANNVISCNTIPHATNQIDLSFAIIDKLTSYLGWPD